MTVNLQILLYSLMFSQQVFAKNIIRQKESMAANVTKPKLIHFIQDIEKAVPFSLKNIEAKFRPKWSSETKFPYFILYESTNLKAEYHDLIEKLSFQLPTANANFKPGLEIKLRADVKETPESLLAFSSDFQAIPDPAPHLSMKYQSIKRAYGRISLGMDDMGHIRELIFHQHEK
jgi:hypothetical protein